MMNEIFSLFFSRPHESAWIRISCFLSPFLILFAFSSAAELMIMWRKEYFCLFHSKSESRRKEDRPKLPPKPESSHYSLWICAFSVNSSFSLSHSRLPRRLGIAILLGKLISLRLVCRRLPFIPKILCNFLWLLWVWKKSFRKAAL